MRHVALGRSKLKLQMSPACVLGVPLVVVDKHQATAQRSLSLAVEAFDTTSQGQARGEWAMPTRSGRNVAG